MKITDAKTAPFASKKTFVDKINNTKSNQQDSKVAEDQQSSGESTDSRFGSLRIQEPNSPPHLKTMRITDEGIDLQNIKLAHQSPNVASQ